MTFREQLIRTRALRNLRTWAPPISIGVIIGVLFYFAAEQLDQRADAQAQQPTTMNYAQTPSP